MVGSMYVERAFFPINVSPSHHRFFICFLNLHAVKIIIRYNLIQLFLGSKYLYPAFLQGGKVLIDFFLP